MSLSAVCIRRPVFTSMLMLMPIVLGLVGLSRMGMDLFPNVEIPVVLVSTVRTGTSVEEMETSITKPLEEAINTISGIEEMVSNSKEGISQLRVQFELEKNRDIAMQEVQAKVNTVLKDLPPNTDAPVVDKFDVNATPVLTVVVSGQRSLREVTEIARREIRDGLSGLSGVGSVTLTGGLKRAIQISIDTNKLESFHLSIEQVRQALAAENLEVPGGRVDQSSRELVLRTIGRIEDPRDFNNLIVAQINGQTVRIKDIGRADDSFEEPRGLARLDDKPAVALVVLKQSGRNTVEVIDRVKKRLDELRAALAVQGRGDVTLTVVRDQSVFIQGSLHEVQLHLIYGGLLVSVTILLFLRDWRTMVIASISIPVSIISTFLAMYLAGFTLNNITMLALVMATGIVIDDAVVVHENIFRWMEEKGYSAWEAAHKATNEIALAVLATTISLLVIFLPIAFMSGIVGRFFYSFGLTMAFAIAVSLLVSFTLTPMLCSRFLKLSAKAKAAIAAGQTHQHHSGGIYGWIFEKPYMWALRHALHMRWLVVLATIFTVLSIFPLPVGNWITGAPPATASGAQIEAHYQKRAWMNYPGLAGLMGMDFLPQDDQSEFDIAVTLPPGYSLQRSNELLQQLEARLRQLPLVEHLLTTIGDTTGRSGRAGGDVTTAGIFIRIMDLERRPKPRISQFAIMDQAREILREFPDLRFSIGSGDRGGSNFDVEFFLSGTDLATLDRASEEFLTRMRQLPGVQDVDTNQPQRKPELWADPIRDQASDKKIQIQTIATTLQTMVGGIVVGDFKDRLTGERYDVWLRAQSDNRNTREAIEQLMIPSPTAGLVRLSAVAKLTEKRGTAQIDRYNQQRKISIRANLVEVPRSRQFLFFKWTRVEKMDTGATIAAIASIAHDLRQEGILPLDYQTTFTGRAKAMGDSMKAFMMALLMSMVFMYIVLAAQFESFTNPIAILLALPVTIPFAFLSLILLGQPMNLFSIMGVFLLFGIVKKNGILQVDYTNQLRALGQERNPAVLEANRVRLRPILMTTVMLVSAMIPLALGEGPGAAPRAAMAKVIIGGQAMSLLLSLLITPVAYTLLDDLHNIWKRVMRKLGWNFEAPKKPETPV